LWRQAALKEQREKHPDATKIDRASVLREPCGKVERRDIRFASIARWIRCAGRPNVPATTFRIAGSVNSA